MHASLPPVRLAAEPGFEPEAAAWAGRLGVPLAPAPARFELIAGEAGLGLRPCEPEEPGARAWVVDLGAARPGAEMVVRAVRGRRSVHDAGHVVDATAGLGTDAAALARAGLRVTMIEREPVVAALLEDALARLSRSGDPEAVAAASRLRLLRGDAVAVLGRLDGRPDVVYLDPMYPDLGGGAKGRGMRWLRALTASRAPVREEACTPGDDAALLEAARRSALRRVVCKRPMKAPPLAPGVSGSVRGRTTRFDLYGPSRPDR